MPPDDQSAALAAAEDAAFASGFKEAKPDKAAAKPAEKAASPAPEKAAPAAEPAAKSQPAAGEAAPADPKPPKPEYVKVTRTEWDEVRAAAARTASYDAQFSKAFGTIGNLQKVLTGLQNQPAAAGKAEIPKDAFAELERDFPELATQIRGALERALPGMATGRGPAGMDDEAMDKRFAAHDEKRELKLLDEDYPDWRQVVGAVNAAQQAPDPNNPYRKWLATKDAAYQAKVNASASAAVIGRSIEQFRSETKKPPAPKPDARADRLRGVLQPRGDGAGAAAGPSDDEEFEAGFNSR